MQQPQGFIDLAHLDFVCHLHKSIYGIKQAPRAWFHRFTSYVDILDFHPFSTDPSLLIQSTGKFFTILLLYVDDIIISVNDLAYTSKLLQQLSTEFEMKDLGPLHYFLGLEVRQSASGIFLSQ